MIAVLSEDKIYKLSCEGKNDFRKAKKEKS